MKRMIKRAFLPSFLISLFLASCNVTPDGFWSGDSNVNHRFSGLKKLSESDAEVKSWGEEEKYQVLVLTDVHIGAKFYHKETEDRFFNWLKNYTERDKIKFALGLGDFTDGAKEGEFRYYQQMAEKINGYGIKLLNVVGNHDLYRADGYENYEKYCYPYSSYYKFYTKNLVWYGLDTASGTLGNRQLASLKKELPSELNKPVIITHVPFASEGKSLGIMPFCLRDTTERNILISLFSQCKIAGYFCGHYHPGGLESFGNITQYGLKSFGEFGKWYILDVDETAGPVITIREFGK